MANIKPISMGKGSKLNYKKTIAKANSVKPNFRDDFVSSDWEPIDYNAQFSELSKDNNIGSVGDINKDGKIDQYDVSTLQEYLSLGDGEKLAFAAERGHMFETGRILRKYKDRADLGELIHLAYKGEELQKVEFTADGTYGVSSEDVAEGNAIIREIREAFTQDEYNVGETGINKFMSVYDGKDLYYDINGDGKVNANDVTALQKYNQIIDNKNNDKNATKDSKIDYSGDFSKCTDYQNVTFGAIDFIQYLPVEAFDFSSNPDEAPTIRQFVDSINVDKDDYQLSFFKTLIENGFGDYKIVEIAKDGSFDAIVLQDPNGNYRVFYNSTKTIGGYSSDIGDYLYDARNVVEGQFVNGWVDSVLGEVFNTAGSVAGGFAGGVIGALGGFLLGGPAGAVIGGFSGAAIGSEIGDDVGDAIYRQAISAVRNGLDSDSHGAVLDFIEARLKDADMDENMRTQIIDAIKNGGLNGAYNRQQDAAKKLASKYYNLAEKDGKKLSLQGYSLGGSLAEASYLSLCDKEGADKVLDGLVLLNPYHDNLTIEEASKIKKAKGFELYCAEGDMVSSVFNYDDFKDDAKYLYMDYKNLFKDTGTDGFDFDQLSNFSAIFGDTHILQPYLGEEFNGTHNREAFAEDGSVRKNVNGYDVHGHSFGELSKYLFGGDEISSVDDLGKAMVAKGTSSLLGIFFDGISSNASVKNGYSDGSGSRAF